MRFHIPAFMVLASAASVTAIVDQIVSHVQSDLNQVQTDLNAVTSIDNNLHNLKSSVVNDFKNLLPTISVNIVINPSNVEGFFSTVKNDLENLPQTAWNGIKTGLYPTEVVSWIDSLPTNLRGEASSKLNAWANEVGTGGASTPTATNSASKSTGTGSSSDSNQKAVKLGAMGVAGLLAVAIVL